MTPALAGHWKNHRDAVERSLKDAGTLVQEGWPERALPLVVIALVWIPGHLTALGALAHILDTMGQEPAAVVVRRHLHRIRATGPSPAGAGTGDEWPAPAAAPPPRFWSWLAEGCRATWKLRVPSARRGWNRRIPAIARLSLEILAVLVVRALRPLVLIRFGGLRVDRIGHFCIETELYLGEREKGLHGRRSWDGLYFESEPCNGVLARLVRRRLWVSPAFRSLHAVNGCFRGAGKHEVFSLARHYQYSQDREGVLLNAPPLITLNARERAEGARRLQRLGIPLGTPFVCFHVRDAAYPRERFGEGSFQIQTHRNGQIEDFLPAVERFVARGFHAVRMGNRVEKPLPVTDSQIIDYACREPSDFMDLYLSMNCALFIGSTSGLIHAARLARRPILISNFIPLMLMPPPAQEIIIPRRVLSHGVPLTLKELLSNGFHVFLTDMEYGLANLTTEPNTPEEIADAAEELWLRSLGRWTDTEEDRDLRKRFETAIRRVAPAAGGPVCPLATTYLRRNPWFLDGL